MRLTRADFEALCHELVSPDGGRRKVLGLMAARELAKLSRMRLKELEIKALENGILPEHYERNIDSFGLAGQLKLLRSRAAVIGLGGLGGYAAEVLARAGVGFIRLVDGDRFQESNLNRQLFARAQSVGKNKALIGKTRLRRVNPGIELEAIPQYLDESNALPILNDLDLIVDALGELPSRLLLAREARKLKKTLIHAAIAGFFGQLAVIHPEGPELDKIYGLPAGCPPHGVEKALGIPAPTPAVLGTMEAALAVRVLLGQDQELGSRLLLVDLNRMLWQEVKL